MLTPINLIARAQGVIGSVGNMLPGSLPITVTRTAMPATVAEADASFVIDTYASIGTDVDGFTVSPFEIYMLNTLMRVDIQSLSSQLHMAAYVDVIGDGGQTDNGTLIGEQIWTTTGTKYAWQHLANKWSDFYNYPHMLPYAFARLARRPESQTPGRFHTVYLFLWVDSGQAVIPYAEIWHGIGRNGYYAAGCQVEGLVTVNVTGQHYSPSGQLMSWDVGLETIPSQAKYCAAAVAEPDTYLLDSQASYVPQIAVPLVASPGRIVVCGESKDANDVEGLTSLRVAGLGDSPGSWEFKLTPP